MTVLEDRIAEIATVPVLLVATDYDGTIAPIVNDPDQAKPHREAIVALRMLAALPQTHVAIISGRALTDLSRLAGLPEHVHLVGSHGSEFDVDYARQLPEDVVALRERVANELSEIAQQGNGFTLERKPQSIALHYRNASDEDADRALKAATNGPGAIEGVFTKHGKKVVEFSVVASDKGAALHTIRQRCGASATIFFGDDQTDEDAFRQLRGPDVAVKVGSQDSIAPYRIEGPEDAARLLARLGELRALWIEGAAATPIDCHSLLSDQRALALVADTGRIDWFCAPRSDSAAIFAELIGGPTAGYFSILPEGGAESPTQEYLDNSLILQTRWRDLVVTDLLDCSAGRPGQRAGRTDLLRIIEGNRPAIIEFAPRLDFGRSATHLHCRDGGLEIQDTLDPVVLRSPGVVWTIKSEGNHHTATARVHPKPNQPVVLELRYGSGRLREESTLVLDRVNATRRFWSNWVEGLKLPSVEKDMVRRSALILKGLCYGPTGAILAAGTTSLPEHIGGLRNWDYRYCWLRDAALAAVVFARLGSIQEGLSLLNWICNVVDACESPDRLHPLYTVTGDELGAEADITELCGYHASRPVRIGNAAARQVQLDVYGPIVDLIAVLMEAEAPISSEHWRLVQEMVAAVQQRWESPDHGIWEIRRPRRHHVHSKVMCWYTVDRAIRIADQLLDREMPEWVNLRDRIAADVIENGYKSSVGAYTAAYDDADLDAASLHVGLSGLLPADDPRFLSTIEAVSKSLRDGPTVYRYRTDDGLAGFEGGFHICTAWLIQSLLLVGRVDEGRELFDNLCRLAGPTGTLSEQYDPNAKQALGNTPQAYSHLAIISVACDLHALSDESRSNT